jgi:hypothetical protein
MAALESGWPIVPVTENWPPLLAPPPPETLYQPIE